MLKSPRFHLPVALGALLSVAVACMPDGTASEATTVHITGEIALAETVPIGINIGMSDPWWDVQLRRTVTACNFEGGLHRDIYRSYPFPAGGGDISVDPNSAKRGLGKNRISDYVGGTYTVVSGPHKWQQGRITAIDHMTDEGRYPRAVLRLDPQVPDGERAAIMLHRVVPEEAYDGKRQGVRLEDGCRFVFAEADPASFGNTCVLMDGSESTALIRLFPGAHQHMDMNITWTISLRMKARSGEPTLRIHTEGRGEERTLQPGSEWELVELTMPVDGMPPRPDELTYLRINLEASGGEVLIDDIKVTRSDDEQSSEFRDETIDLFRQSRIGIVRVLQGSNSTLRDTIMPRLRSRNGIGSLHRFYEFCAEIGAEPWYSLPATLTREEMQQFMEYLAAPADVGYGRVRAELGQEEPWLDVLPGVIVEFGNELYNFGGFGGADYWHDLIEAGRASPWHREAQVHFIMGHQGNALEHAQNMDGFAISGYHCWGFSRELYEQHFATQEHPQQAVQRWATAASVLGAIDPGYPIPQDVAHCRELGIEPAMYEGWYHFNFGTAGPEPRNRLLTSLGGGTSYITHILLKMQHLGMRRQAFFAALGQGHQFKGQSAFGSEDAGYVRVFGHIVRLDSDERRLRPGWLAMQVANQAIIGDLVVTAHSGPQPSFDASGPDAWNLRAVTQGEPGDIQHHKDVPAIHSFAFRDDDERGLILVNLLTDRSHAVQVTGIGEAHEPRMWSLKAPSWQSTNELDWQPDGPTVSIDEQELDQWRDGQALELAPMQMRAIRWRVK